MPVFLILHNIRSVYNVGAIFRTAECAGVEKIYLAGYTPAPVDRFGRSRSDFRKAALGAEALVPWEAHKSAPSLIKKLKKEKVRVAAVEQAPRALDYKKLRVTGPTALVLGNEVRGLSGAVLRASDVVIQIPLAGRKESLNVSVAAGIVLFRVLDL